MASRHSFVLFAAMLCGWMFVWWLFERPSFRTLFGRTVALGLPAFVIGLILLVHNHARFGEASEFGHNHQIGLVDPNTVSFVDPGNIPYNTVLNLFQPPRFDDSFPFVRATNQKLLEWVSPSENHIAVESAIGLAVIDPFLLLVPFLIVRVVAKPGVTLSGRGWVLSLLVLLGGLFVLQFAIIASFSFSVFRYSLDYLPWIILCFVVAWSQAEARCGRFPLCMNVVLTLALLWSVLLHLGLAFDRIVREPVDELQSKTTVFPGGCAGGFDCGGPSGCVDGLSSGMDESGKTGV